MRRPLLALAPSLLPKALFTAPAQDSLMYPAHARVFSSSPEMRHTTGTAAAESSFDDGLVFSMIKETSAGFLMVSNMD